MLSAHTKYGSTSLITLLLIFIFSACTVPTEADEDFLTSQVDPFGVTDYQPTWSPSGNWIAYRHGPSSRQGSGVYLIREDGSDEQLLVPNGAWPSWSIDGSMLAIKSSGISIIEMSSMSTTHIAAAPFGAHQISWHPSTERILFKSLHGDSTNGIWDYNLNTGEAVLLFKADQVNGGGNYPEWNPQGDTVVFINSTIESYYLCLLKTPYEDVVRLLDVDDLGGGQMRYPTFSPDGSLIAFTATATADEECRTWIYHLSSGFFFKVIDGGEDPSWSPDGNALLYSRHIVHTPGYGYDVEGNGMLWILNLTNGEHHQLTGR